MNFHFYKYQGTGNDFVIMDNRDGSYDSITRAQVKYMCDRRFGIGGDGLMLLNLIDNYDFEMKYYNADGNESSMCGNGGRCLVKFASDLGMQQSSYHFIAIDGPHEANFSEEGWVQLKMKDVSGITTYKEDSVLDTGSPHYIKKVLDCEKVDVYNQGKDIRYSTDFTQQGINVNFVEQQDRQIMVRTYERGVENETLSCGTGVTAAALVCANNTGFNHINIKTLGGNLAVKFDKMPENLFENIWLCGPATFVFKGEIEVE